MGGYFVSDQMNANGFASAVYYDGTVEEVLSMMYVEVKAGGSGGINWSSLGGFNIGRRIQDHVYRNSSLYQYHRDQMKERQMDEFQEGMDYLGTFDPTFLVDGLNGLGYLFRGQYGNAAIAGIAMVPYVGDLGKGGKYLNKFSTAYKETSGTIKATGNGIPNSVYNYLGKDGTLVSKYFYNDAGKVKFQIDFRDFNSSFGVHGHQMSIPGSLSSGHTGQHVPFMLIPKNYW